ncbi:hypothetical protein ACPFP2_10925 [Micromonospora citrea]|uniref:hypothetical protein n=1 Tax=Micromonospora citrea TaxID=47855 RepID=UPI003C3D07A0
MRTATVATTGWCTRLLLLVCTLLGLAAMHTIGHGSHGSGHSDGHAVAQGAALPEALPAVAHVAAPEQVRAERPTTPTAAGAGTTAVGPPVVPVAGDGCPDDGCRHGAALPAGDPGGHPGVLGVCLAVLGTLTVTLLLAALVFRWRRPVPDARRSIGRSAGSRAPPGRPVGLRLATVSVLRR